MTGDFGVRLGSRVGAAGEQLVRLLQQVLDDTGGRAPDQGVVDYVSIGFKGDAAALHARACASGAQRVERELQYGVDLGGRHLPALAGGDQADEGVDQVAGDERRGRGKLAQDLDVDARQADLLLGLAQRGFAQIGVLGVVAAAGKGDLSGVAAQVGAPAREDRVGLLVRAEEQRYEDRRGDLVRELGQGALGDRGGGRGLQDGDALDAFLEHDLSVERAMHGALRRDHAQALDLLLG
jgi:hypothetical protein